MQPRSQGSLLPALSLRRSGWREPWERGCNKGRKNGNNIVTQFV